MKRATADKSIRQNLVNRANKVDGIFGILLNIHARKRIAERLQYRSKRLTATAHIECPSEGQRSGRSIILKGALDVKPK